MKTAAAVAAVAVATLIPRTSHATELYVEGNVFGGGSVWEADPNVEGALRSGFEFADIASVELQGRLGYGAVDQRMLMLVGLGTRLSIPIQPIVPYMRLHVLHSHESPVAAMQHDPFMHILGVGDGIRHRFGFEGALGARWDFTKKDDTMFSASVEALVDAYPDDGKGPQLYAGAGLGLGLEYSL